MEDSAIRGGLCQPAPRARTMTGCNQAALCRAKADWLVGINATRLFLGAVPPHPQYRAGHVPDAGPHRPAGGRDRRLQAGGRSILWLWTCPVLPLPAPAWTKKADAEQLKTACQGGTVTVKQVERRDKSEKPPALYDLTTLQRDANRLLGFTAQQTLDYLQNLYEKKLCTYPRTDSRYLTSDMGRGPAGAGEFGRQRHAVSQRHRHFLRCGGGHPRQESDRPPCGDPHPEHPRGGSVRSAGGGERAILELVALRLLCAVAPPYNFAENRRCCGLRWVRSLPPKAAR